MKRRTMIIFLLLALALSGPALAVDTGELEAAVPDSARELLGDLTVGSLLSGGHGLEGVWDWCLAQLRSRLGGAARSACGALAVTLACSVACAASPEGTPPPYVLLGGALAVMGLCAGELNSFLGQVRAALADLSDFSRALLPCMAAAAAAAGHAASGAARYTASALFLDILMTAGRDLILPMLYGYCAVSTANAALPEGALGGPVRLMAWACKTLLTALTTVFTLGLSLSGVIAGGADRLAGSVAKTAITAALPVVGKILSDAADTYLAGAQLLRGAVGVFGLAAVLGVCAGPLIGLGLHYLLFKAAAAVSEPFSDGRLSALLGHIAACYGMALGLLGSAGLMLFVAVVVETEAIAL